MKSKLICVAFLIVGVTFILGGCKEILAKDLIGSWQAKITSTNGVLHYEVITFSENKETKARDFIWTKFQDNKESLKVEGTWVVTTENTNYLVDGKMENVFVSSMNLTAIAEGKDPDMSSYDFSIIPDSSLVVVNRMDPTDYSQFYPLKEKEETSEKTK